MLDLLRLLLGGLLVLLASWGAERLVETASAAGEPRARPSLQTPPPSVGKTRVDYRIEARLDTELHRLKGSAVVVFHNGSTRSLEALYLHLYLNAFKNERTVFMRSRHPGFRGGGRPAHWGWIEVERVFAREWKRELWPSARQHTPGDEQDETDIRLPLPQPLAPGQTLTLEMRWRSQLPSLVHRTGFAGKFHMVAQWFPKLARLEPDGRWAHFAFERLSEFYADFGDYDVTIDAPAGFVIGACGEQQGEAKKVVQQVAPPTRARVKHRFLLERAHDFAFAAWDGFGELRQRGPAGVVLRGLYPLGEERLARRDLEMVGWGLQHFGQRYGPYPYSSLTVVRPPANAQDAGGMEYPTLITTGGSWYWPSLGVRRLAILAVHELAHQWFYGLLASDEHRWPFLDEGLATYAAVEALETKWPATSAFGGLGLRIGLPALLRVAAARVWDHGPIARPASAFASGSDYGGLVYSRTATLLLSLGRVFGQDKLRAALSRYARQQRFAHPDPEALLAAVKTEMGDLAETVLRRGLFDSGWVDYAVEGIDSGAVGPAEGVFGDPAAPQPAPASAAGPAAYRGVVRVRRSGNLALPVQIEMVAADGSRSRVDWDGRGAHATLPFSGSSPLVAALIDPDQRVLLDHDLSNNARSVAPQSLAPRVLARAGLMAQLLAGALFP